ncbi:S49 family peptidase [Bradyrhizobium sp. JYMT SZCCT0428]|uniref:S49 family peptidase n=1 Tax=Bradyrhizobium sp. JYMT SZCCT0428 TaxID=2807673 RepID=UPI001BA7FBD4|nr:S49 family peptidase [Bradyrhizobium sp. JYMT SZCCT0428]MBR1154601.1 S49 family peptidase [Bradyrhizobium sp. JYMT SZCCT0428]
MTQLAHIADRVLNRPLMILPDKLSLIASVLEGRIGIDAAGLKPDHDMALPDASRFVGTFEEGADGKRKAYRTTADGVAVIPVIGSLVNRGGWLGAISGITSYENLKFQVAAAAKDDSVKAIILDMDSPGGEAVGAFETADVVGEAAQVKPVYAMATGLCCSAAYAIASASTKIITSKSSVIGSIGVVLLHADYSHALHERGVVPTLIHAGKKKVDGTPYKPLTDDVKASLKTEVENFNSLFVATVAEGRPSLTADAILAMEAGTYIGAAAVAVGLADAVGSFESVLADLSARAQKIISNKPRGRLMTDQNMINRADHEAAIAQARGEATVAERARIKSVTSLEEAKCRPAAALNLALTTFVSAAEAKTVLAGIEMEVTVGASWDAIFERRGMSVGNSAPALQQPGAGEIAAGWDAVLESRGMKIAR